MKKLLVSLFLIALTILLALNCPKKKSHLDSITDVINNVIGDKTKDSGMLGLIMGSVGSYFVSNIVENNLIVDDYLIFSLGKISFQEKSMVISVGLLNHVFILSESKMIEHIKSSNSDNAYKPSIDHSAPKIQSKPNDFSSGIEKNTNRDKYPHNR